MKKLSLFLTILLVSAKCYCQKLGDLPVNSNPVDSGTYFLGTECTSGHYATWLWKAPKPLDTTWLSNRINAAGGDTVGLSNRIDSVATVVGGMGLNEILAIGNTTSRSINMNSNAYIQGYGASGNFFNVSASQLDVANGYHSIGFYNNAPQPRIISQVGSKIAYLSLDTTGTSTILCPTPLSAETLALRSDSSILASTFRVDSGVYNTRTYVQNWGLDQVLGAGNTSSHSIVLSSGANSASIQNFNISMANGTNQNQFVYNGFQFFNGTNATNIGYTTPVANTTINYPALSSGTYTVAVTSQINYHTNSTQVLTGASTANIVAPSSGSHCICGIESSTPGAAVVKTCAMAGTAITVTFTAPVTATTAMSVVYW